MSFMDTCKKMLEMDIESSPSHDLKCSLCKNYLNVPPVLTSEDGKVTKCGRCQFKGPKLKNRNSLYESIGSKLRYPCKNEQCKDRLTWMEVDRHEKSCSQRKIACPFYNCRDKNISFVISRDVGHFESSHPGSMHYGAITLNFRVITHHQSFIKLLIVDGIPFLMFIHCLKYGDAGVLVGIFTCDKKQCEYEIRVRQDGESNRYLVIKDRVQLYDEQKHCLYCLQNICFLEDHKFSKKHPENQDKKYKHYSNVDIVSAKALLQCENFMFDISVHAQEDDEKNSIISRNSD